MKKLLCLSLALLMMVLVVTSCVGDPVDTDLYSDTTPDTQGSQAGILEILKDGEMNAVIITPGGDTELFMLGNKLATAIYKKYGVLPEPEYDTDIAYDVNRVEILIGETNRPESTASTSKLSRSDDYLCELSGNKLVLTGMNPMSVEKAIDYFIFEYITFGSDTEILYSSTDDFLYFNKYTIEIDSCAGHALTEYTIVYPKNSSMGEYYTALNLRYHLFKDLGMEIPVVDDSTAANDLEILIGKTNRGITPEVADGKFSVTVKNDNLCVSANDFFGFISADKYLTDTLFSKYSDADTLTETFSYTAEAERGPERGGDYRIIFNNCWGLDEVAYANRDEYSAAFYLAYQPDVIALNELWDGYRTNGVIDDTLKSNGYVELIAPNKTADCYSDNKSHGDPNTNVLPIFYNPKKVKPIESAYIHFKWYAAGSTQEAMENGTASLIWADDSKAMTVAVFEGLDANGNGNGERFIVCNTHFTSNYYDVSQNTPMHGYYSRLYNMEFTWTQLQPYIDEYSDASVLMGCDFNCHLGSDEIKKIESYGFVNVHDTAEVTDNHSSAHAYPTYNEYLGYFVSSGYNPTATYSGSIDHIYSYGDTIEAKMFDTLTTEYSCLFSDHSPLLLDFNVVESSAS